MAFVWGAWKKRTALIGSSCTATCCVGSPLAARSITLAVLSTPAPTTLCPSCHVRSSERTLRSREDQNYLPATNHKIDREQQSRCTLSPPRRRSPSDHRSVPSCPMKLRPDTQQRETNALLLCYHQGVGTMRRRRQEKHFSWRPLLYWPADCAKSGTFCLIDD